MRRVCLALVLLAAACGGPQIPTHNGYKSDKVKPWKKAKQLAFDDKHEAKTDGDLSYPDMRRARWFGIDLPGHGELTYRLEITPPGEGTNEDFDLAAEVLGPDNRVIQKADEEDSDAHELVKTHTLVDLAPGHYLIHLYLQGRMDTADFSLAVSYKSSAAGEAKTDFPAQVPFPKPLPQVTVRDDSPLKPPKVATVTTTHVTHHTQPKSVPVVTAPAAPAGPHAARILNLQAAGTGTQITLSVGTKNGATTGMSGSIPGVANSSFTLAACGERSCSATVAGATADQIKASGLSVTFN